MANRPDIPSNKPVHGFANIENHQNNGFYMPRTAYFVASGTLSNIDSHTTGSIQISLHTYAAKLKRFETFHSGSATTFNISVESSTPNTGSVYDPRNVIVTYSDVAGSADFSSGVDQLEDLVALTDASGSLYVKFIPKGTGTNTFKYLIFFESAYVLIG